MADVCPWPPLWKKLTEVEVFAKTSPKKNSFEFLKNTLNRGDTIYTQLYKKTRNGTIYIDSGAAKALTNGKSLLAAGITKIDGNFKKGENVIILNQKNIQVARGLSSFSSTEIDKIKGKQSKEIETILGYLSKTEVIHKDDMVLL